MSAPKKAKKSPGPAGKNICKCGRQMTRLQQFNNIASNVFYCEQCGMIKDDEPKRTE
jgi:predicted SprT family Zn-dependent metalloprotease